MESKLIRPIALYLPQFHPIPENDQWWGKGFTEWTNVAKAKPLFKGHWQPRLPTDLGFYDLRVPEVRIAQAELAKEYGIYGFCYWHYWFAGKRLIERPFAEVVASGKPDFPFCVAWANQTWEGTWHGLSNNQILIEQTYPGKEDYIAHFYSLLTAFQDCRYMQVDGKKLVFVFRPMDIPDPKEFTDTWQSLALKEGLNGIHFVGMHMPAEWNPSEYGYDAKLHNWANVDRFRIPSKREVFERKFVHPRLRFLLTNKKPLPKVISYKEYVNHYPEYHLKENEYPWIFTGWDNTPRCGKDGWLFEDCNPELFGELCLRAFKETENKPTNEKIVIIKSWNEWAEGNILEPDNNYGIQFLKALKKSMAGYLNEK
ncbi:MAG: glycosyltransferase WbsX family protein [Ginsengibacter sp.]